MSEDGWWDEYTYARALIVTERDPDARRQLAEAFGFDPDDFKATS
jgi:hypothetical protein